VKKMVLRSELADLWRKKELERGKIITIQEVAKATGLNWETVDNLKAGRTTRFDADVIQKIGDYFGVIEEGKPAPFLVFRLVEIEQAA